MLILGTKIKTIKEHFSEALSQYQIPYYQRKYEWGVEQVEALLNDIIEHINLNRGIDIANAAIPTNLSIPKYLIGSIFLYTANPNGMEPEIFIIDGQQRTTTITLIAMALRKRIDYQLSLAQLEPEFSHRKATSYIQRFVTPLEELYKFPVNDFAQDSELRTKIKVVHGEKFYNQMAMLDFKQDGSVDLISHRFHKNIKAIEDSLVKYEGENYAASVCLDKLCILAGTLMNFTNMAVIVAESPAGQNPNHTEVINIFSKINARGKDLSQSDMLKVYFLQGLTDNEVNIANQWDEVFENVESINIDSYFTHLYAAIKTDFPKTISDAWADYLFGVNQQQKNNILTSQVFPLFSVSHEEALMENDSIVLLRELGFNEWQSIIYWVRINKIEQKKIIKKLLNVCFCLTVLGHHDKTRRRLLKQIFWDSEDSGSDITYKTLVESTINRLKEEDVYLFSAIKRKFVLHFIDRVLNGGIGANYDHRVAHIEHVLPQNSSQWLDVDGWTSDLINKWTHKVGNLVFLPRRINSQVSNSKFLDKISVIETEINENNQNINAYGLRFSLTNESLRNIKWTPEYVESRHLRVIERTKIWLLTV